MVLHFKNFDAVGLNHEKDGEFVIDSSGVLPGGKIFKDSAELKAILVEKKELFIQCIAEKMLICALELGLEYHDKPTLDRMSPVLEKDNYKFLTLVLEIAKSDPFRLRRGK